MEIGNQQGNIKITRQFSNISKNVINDIKNPNYLYFLGGFVEGEGSNSVSISIGRNPGDY